MPITLGPFAIDEVNDRAQATLTVDELGKFTVLWTRDAVVDARQEVAAAITQLVLDRQRDAVLAQLTPDVIAEAVKDGIARAVVSLMAKGLGK
jgi:nitrate reductase beta subunit